MIIDNVIVYIYTQVYMIYVDYYCVHISYFSYHEHIPVLRGYDLANHLAF